MIKTRKISGNPKQTATYHSDAHYSYLYTTFHIIEDVYIYGLYELVLSALNKYEHIYFIK